jgi:signal transduction histidine kinase/DNA-binding response OmpR family regulator
MSKPVSILLVDDEVKNLIALESILESPDYDLVKAQTANEALLALMEREYAAIVLDVQMPEIDGIELARLIKQRKKTQHIPILFLTAYYQAEEHIVEGYGVGAVDYLTKPVNPDVLRSKIGVFLDLFQKTRALAAMNQAMSGEIAERQKAEEALRTAYAQLEAKNAELEGQAEERARRIRAEAAQAEAEAARERSALLAEASRMFASTFEAAATLRSLARLVAPKLADGCMVDIVGEDGAFVPVVISHIDPKREEYLRVMRAQFPLRLSDSGPVAAALRAGTPLVRSNVTDEEINAIARSPEEADAIREYSVASFMIVPLRARERTLGALYLGHDTARTYRDSESSLAVALAERAALALDNVRLYTEAEQARAAAEAANAAKDRFLAMLSHELRTPLSPVLHAVTILDGEPDVPPQVREILGTIHRNVQLEARLIDDLLDLARVRNGKLQLQPDSVDAHELIRQAAEICRPEIDQRELRIYLKLAAKQTRLWADPARVQQIFWNLITNAIKFTPRGGLITLTSEDGPDGQLIVEVSDTGRGIAPERISKIFDAFEQVDRHQSTGLGLGLAICKALTELHGGSIEARSAGWECGSTFIVRLPVAREESAPAQAAPARQPDAPSLRLRLLLVEDHIDTAAMLRRLLARRGYEVRAAESVETALDAARDFDLDVLLSDIGLPDGTGIDLIHRLSELKGGQSFRAIALSGFGMHEDLERSKSAGFSEHLTKPVDFALLERTLTRIGQEIAGR